MFYMIRSSRFCALLRFLRHVFCLSMRVEADVAGTSVRQGEDRIKQNPHVFTLIDESKNAERAWKVRAKLLLPNNHVCIYTSKHEAPF